jgi:hypothetical protein
MSNDQSKAYSYEEFKAAVAELENAVRTLKETNPAEYKRVLSEIFRNLTESNDAIKAALG